MPLVLVRAVRKTGVVENINATELGESVYDQINAFSNENGQTGVLSVAKSCLDGI